MPRIFLAITLCLTYLAVSAPARDCARRSKRPDAKHSNKANVGKRSRLPAGGQPLCDPTPHPAILQGEPVKGRVTVKVLIDEEGKVISADVLSGDPGARKAAVDAALRETFSPRRLSGRAVKTMGVITYNFTERGAVTKESESH